jgi:hypothetical protein
MKGPTLARSGPIELILKETIDTLAGTQGSFGRSGRLASYLTGWGVGCGAVLGRVQPVGADSH